MLSKRPKTAYIAAHTLLSNGELNECHKTALDILKADELVWSLKDKPELIIYAGGVDISPSLYGEKSHELTQRPNTYRDGVEVATFEAGCEWNATHVGICRGGQLLNVLNGGKLWQHVDNHEGDHSVMVYAPKKYQNYYLASITSAHHQVMIPPRNGNEKHNPYVIVAEHKGTPNPAHRWITNASGRVKPPQQEIEGIWFPRTNSLAVQFHPGWSDSSAKVLQDLYEMYVNNGSLSCVA